MQSTHFKGIRTMCIQQYGRAHVFFSHHSRNTRQRDLQFIGRRGRWKEKSALDTPRFRRFHSQPECCDCGFRWVTLQMQLQQFQQRLALIQRDGKLQFAAILFPFF